MANYKTSSIDLNVPTKVLPCNVTSATEVAKWTYDDGKGDKWWSGGANPKAYRWEITVSVTTVSHGSHLTRTPNVFNGYDVQVGDFIAGATDGRALQIVSISAKTAFTVTCQVEDVLRYNTFRSATGSGIFTVPGGAVIFQLNENGDPMLDPLPTGIVSSDFYANVNSRFKYLNPADNYLISQTNNGFEEGDVICIDSDTNSFVLASSDNIDKLVGTVTHAGPGPNNFLLRPANGVIDFVPGLPGEVGDFIYPAIDGSGDLTLTDTGVAIFLKLVNEVPSIVRGSITNGQCSLGDVMEINDVNVSFSTNTLGNVSILQAVNDINQKTSQHKVSAEASPAPNVVQSDINTYGSAYGLIGGFAPFSATINGTLVNFTTTTAGQAAYGMAVAIAQDMAGDINLAGVPNLTASADANGRLVLTQSLGDAITIVNGQNDAQGSPFAGMNSISSLAASYAGASGVYVLQLTRSDGGEIIIRDITGSATSDFGLISGHSGSYAVGLNVEQGVRKAGTVVVSSIAARDALPTKLTGDSAYVLDTGQGEWALYIWDGSDWTLVATEDSAATDANSLSTTITCPVTGFGTAKTITLGRISDNSKIVSVLVEVLTPFSGYSDIPSLEIGIVADPSRFMSGDQCDLESQGSYTTTPDFHYSGAAELEIKAYIEHFNATAGEIKITVTYV
jgi:hypothetical protein